MPIPSRSEHLWRYTPWPRIHPSKPDAVPVADEVIFTSNGTQELTPVPHSQKPQGDIARAFLQAAGG
ncbi:MAG: hypothetical protein P8R00_02955, partial [Candidatus Poseidoniaceae archaeon]|nr:hypothetical protein [Candidatus Poseidoniaceae archaeon]